MLLVVLDRWTSKEERHDRHIYSIECRIPFINLLSTTIPLEPIIESIPDNRLERGSGSWGNLGSLGLSVVRASDLPGRLIKPRLDAVLPILLEMGVLNHVVMLRSHFKSLLFLA